MKLTDRLRNLTGLSSPGQQNFNLEKAKKKLIALLRDETRRASDTLGEYRRNSFEHLDTYHPSQEGLVQLASRRVRETRLIHNDSPFIIGKGSRQLVLKLGEGAVAKTVLAEQEEQQTFGDFYVVELLKGYHPFVTNVPALIETIGFASLLYPHHYFDVTHAPDGAVKKLMTPAPLKHAEVVITQDLSYRGIFKPYEVIEYEKRKTCHNHLLLEDQGEAILDTLLELYTKFEAAERSEGTAEYGIGPISHHAEWNDDPRTAFAKMLLIQVHPRTRRGRLVFGDLDHIAVWNYNET
jgi:hypothetical protein